MTTKLDDELAAAIRPTGDEGDAPAVEKPAARRAGGEPRGGRNVGLLVALLAMVGALVALFMVGFKDAAVYAMPLDKLVSGKDQLAGRKVRVEAELVPGTLVKRDQPCEYRFVMHGQQEKLPVRYAKCVIPDTFRDVPEGGVQVTVEGALSRTGEFEATLVMAKCASKYDPKTHKMKDDALPVN